MLYMLQWLVRRVWLFVIIIIHLFMYLSNVRYTTLSVSTQKALFTVLRWMCVCKECGLCLMRQRKRILPLFLLENNSMTFKNKQIKL